MGVGGRYSVVLLESVNLISYTVPVFFFFFFFFFCSPAKSNFVTAIGLCIGIAVYGSPLKYKVTASAWLYSGLRLMVSLITKRVFMSSVKANSYARRFRDFCLLSKHKDARARAHTHTRARTHPHTRARARTHARTHARAHTHTHTHTHTQTHTYVQGNGPAPTKTVTHICFTKHLYRNRLRTG